MLQTRALLRTAALIRHTKPQLLPCSCWLPHPATFSTSHRRARPSPSLEDIDDAADRRQSSALPVEERTRPKGKAKTPPKHRKRKELPELIEEDLEESFVRGSGPGGQATNKTSNACSLIHRPTGIRVHCHETRSRETNRKLARRILREKLDQLLSPPGESAKDLEAARERQKKEAKKRKARRKLEERRAVKGRTGTVAAEEDGVEEGREWEDVVREEETTTEGSAGRPELRDRPPHM
ncbi:Rso55p [Rhodotorula paludigena]|uniref:Rso55p n=1 Tax=Rhodotorula paludigena TaxID=86838 RepID=UPI00317A34E4